MTVAELNAKKYNTRRLSGAWADLLGEQIEIRGVWFVWGASNSGKTSFALQACKMFAEEKHGVVLYNSVEQRDSYSIKLAINRVCLGDVKGFLFLPGEPIEALTERLARPKSPDIVVIDSIQHARMSYEQVCALSERFPKKLFVFVSHAKGKEPSGKDAEDTRYLADVKIRVEGCKAFAQSRYGGGKDYVIYEPRANAYWGDKDRPIQEQL